MNTNLDSIDLEHDLIQRIVTEAVRMGLETPLRNPILDAVEAVSDGTGDRTGEKLADEAAGTAEGVTTDGETEKSLATTALQGLAVFAALTVVLYASLRRLTGDEEQ